LFEVLGSCIKSEKRETRMTVIMVTLRVKWSAANTTIRNKIGIRKELDSFLKTIEIQIKSTIAMGKTVR